MQQEELTVQSGEAGRFLAESAHYLAPFALQPNTVVQAASTLGLPLGRVHYWVRKAEALGLLLVHEERRRAGRAQRFYLTAARNFVVPAELMDIGRRIDHEESLYRHYLSAVERSQPELLGDGRLTVNFSEHGANLNFGSQGWAGEVLHIWAGSLHLLPEDARQLRQALTEVFRSFYARHSTDEKATPYLLHLGVVKNDRID